MDFINKKKLSQTRGEFLIFEDKLPCQIIRIKGQPPKQEATHTGYG